MVVVKIEHEGDIRRVTINETTGFTQLLALVAELYGKSLPEAWVLKYKDSDGNRRFTLSLHNII